MTERARLTLDQRALDVLATLATNRWALALGVAAAAGCVLQAGWAGLDWGWEAFWNDVRLSRAYAASSGFDLYGSANEGNLSGHLYGPVGFFLYAPVLLASTPGGAIRLGIALSALLVFLPFALAIGGRERTTPRAALFLAAFFHLFWSPSTQTLWSIHVDAPAVGLILVSWICLTNVRERPGAAFALAGTGIAAAAALWTKQTALPAAILPSLILWLDGRRRQGVSVFLWMLGSAVAMGVSFGLLYGFGDIWFTMFQLPGRHSIHPGVVLRDFDQFEALLDLLPLAAILVLLRSGSASQDGQARTALLYAATLLPLAVLGRMKVSGADNNYLGPDVFLSLALCLALASAFHQTAEAGESLRKARALLSLLLILQFGRSAAFLAKETYDRSQRTEIAASDAAFEFARQHPGEAYFPWNPLATLMAEGRLYHAAHGVVSRNQAGMPVSREQWRAHLPRNARYVIHPGSGVADALALMPAYSRKTALVALPRWTVLEAERGR